MIEGITRTPHSPPTCGIGDGHVTSLDALMILQAAAGTIELP